MLRIKSLKLLLIKKILLYLLIFSLGMGFGYFYITRIGLSQPSTNVEKNTPKAFLSETYDKIKDNYWDNISDAQLLDFFKFGIEKVTATPQSTIYSNKDQMINAVLSASQGDQQKEKIVSIVSSVLTSLNPPGRSGLFTTKQEEALKNTVENVNPNKDLYKDLGVNKGASESAVAEAYQKKSQELSQDKSAQAQEQLKQLAYAKDVLTKKDTKVRYDQGGVEPTIFTKLVSPTILYLQFKKFSPTSLDEFQKAFESYKDNSNLSSLIFDLRGNIGGAIDATAYFLGFFIGKNQYAFDFYHKGEYLPFKTPTDKLPTISKFKQIVVLVDNQTQSSAEMLTASFKKYNIGAVVGVPTKGWGTVERVFPLDNQISSSEKYSMFLVHSITIRDDNQPIEGRGVEPNINIKDVNWEQQLFSYFRNSELTAAIKQLL